MRIIVMVLLGFWFVGNAYCELLPVARITQAISEYIAEKNRTPKEDLIIDYKDALHDEQMPDGKIDIQVYTSSQTNLIGFTPVGVTILLDDKPYKKFLVHTNVDCKVKAYMATRWINHHELLSNENLELVETYRSKIPLDCVTDQKSLDGKVTKVALPKGRFISYSVIDTPPVIKTKDVVNVVLESGNLKIMSKGTALMDGRVGDVVKLRLLESKKEIYGKVLNASYVNVQMPN